MWRRSRLPREGGELSENIFVCQVFSNSPPLIICSVTNKQHFILQWRELQTAFEMRWQTRRNQISSFGETDESISIGRWASVQSTTGSRGVGISYSNAGYTMFRGSVKGTGYPLHSPVHLNQPVGTSVQSTTGSRGERISGSNAGYTMFWGSVKGTGYPLHSPVFPSLPLPCVTVCHHISTGLD